jgi:hypothetical protein
MARPGGGGAHRGNAAGAAAEQQSQLQLQLQREQNGIPCRCTRSNCDAATVDRVAIQPKPERYRSVMFSQPCAAHTPRVPTVTTAIHHKWDRRAHAYPDTNTLMVPPPASPHRWTCFNPLRARIKFSPSHPLSRLAPRTHPTRAAGRLLQDSQHGVVLGQSHAREPGKDAGQGVCYRRLVYVPAGTTGKGGHGAGHGRQVTARTRTHTHTHRPSSGNLRTRLPHVLGRKHTRAKKKHARHFRTSPPPLPPPPTAPFQTHTQRTHNAHTTHTQRTHNAHTTHSGQYHSQL